MGHGHISIHIVKLIMDISLYTLLSLAVDGGDRSVSHPYLFMLGHQMMICGLCNLNLPPNLFHLPSSVYKDVATHPRRLQLLICLYIVVCYMGNTWGISVYHLLALLTFRRWIFFSNFSTTCI